MSSVAVVCAALVALPYVLSSTVPSYGGDCDTVDKNVELKLNQLFKRLPEKYVVTHLDKTEIGNGVLFLDNPTINGLNEFDPIIKYQVFCTDDEKRIIANIRATFLEVSYPWRFCTGDNGTVSTESGLVGLEVVFVVDRTGEDVKLKVSSVTPLLLERILVHVYGAGSAVGIAFSTIGHLFPAPFRTYWSNVVPEYTKKALMDTLDQLH
ncbi:unnamed protein product [Ixodes pacificus]